jgi:hypothetical protein
MKVEGINPSIEQMTEGLNAFEGTNDRTQSLWNKWNILQICCNEK